MMVLFEFFLNASDYTGSIPVEFSQMSDGEIIEKLTENYDVVRNFSD